MSSIFGNTPFPIREDLDLATRNAWNYLGSPGNWWTGEERVGFVAEVRAARDCRLCAKRLEALSPNPVQGEHDTASSLPSVAIEATHRLTTDAARVSEKLLREWNAAGLTDEAYVEIVSIASTVMGIDSFCDALGMPLIPLPAAQPGEPSRYRPAEAKGEGAWVATIPSDGTGENEAALYGEGKHPPKFVPNVFRAMSLVPDAVRNLRELLSAYYVKDVGNLSLHNSLDRRQIELVAARVSSINECFY